MSSKEKNPNAVAMGKLSAKAREGKTDYAELGRKSGIARKKKKLDKEQESVL